ncbi:MAG: COX15/CtaA family protein [Flavobacteriales bacterium]
MKPHDFSKLFVRFNWWVLVFIYLVVIAGSFVRITGSGMGCPDWPKCFGQWVPPTELSQLPENYKDVFLQKRLKKIENFSGLISSIGMDETAQQILADPDLQKEESFNVRKTWTEYINRLFGFFAGNGLLLIFFWVLLFYRKHKALLAISFFNLIFIAFQGWFGSIVVASNLVPWTITVHLFFALLIISIQIYILRLISPSQSKNLLLNKQMVYVIWLCSIITLVQMFLGTQVREAIDELGRMGIGREQWTEMLGLSFFIHRSFSWLVLILLLWLGYKNEKSFKYPTIRWAIIILIIELLSGVLLAHFNMPALVQTAHLIFATIILGILTMLVFRVRITKPV